MFNFDTAKVIKKIETTKGFPDFNITLTLNRHFHVTAHRILAINQFQITWLIPHTLCRKQFIRIAELIVRRIKVYIVHIKGNKVKIQSKVFRTLLTPEIRLV